MKICPFDDHFAFFHHHKTSCVPSFFLIGRKSGGKRVQHIHIKYDGLGFIPLNELMKEETA